MGYEGGEVLFWEACLKSRKSIRFLAYMDHLLMGYEGGDIVLPGNIFKRLCAGLKSRKNIRFLA